MEQFGLDGQAYSPVFALLSLGSFARKAGIASALMGTLQWGFAHGRPLVTLAQIIVVASGAGVLVVLGGRRGIRPAPLGGCLRAAP